MKTVSTSCSSRGEECDVDLADGERDEIKEDFAIDDVLGHDGCHEGDDYLRQNGERTEVAAGVLRGGHNPQSMNQ